jgi:hypothetical protein
MNQAIPMKQVAIAVCFVSILLLTLSAAQVSAQSGGGYDLTWSTIESGGATSNGGGFALTGTIGQADAGSLSGGTYSLYGGFWNVIVQGLSRFFLPFVRK